MVTARELVRIWSLRLQMHDEGEREWTPAMRASVTSLLKRLESLDPAEIVEIDAKIDRDPIGRFVRAATGEVLGEINQHVGWISEA